MILKSHKGMLPEGHGGRGEVYGLWFMVYGLWFMVYGLSNEG